ncbi:MAG: hypothetical protein AB7E30_03980 [Lawsonibacter sp.]
MAREKQVPFQKIQEACKTTGLSMYYLRGGCKAGTVPHVKSGGTYYINVPALLRSLGALPEGTGETGPGDHPAAVTDIRTAGRRRAQG